MTPSNRAGAARRRWSLFGKLFAAGAVLLMAAILWLALDTGLNVWRIKTLAARGQGPAAASVERISYRSEGQNIAADLYVPKDPRGFAVFAHGNRPEGRSHALARDIAAALGRHFVTLAFDFRGYGESGPLPPYHSGMTLDLTSDILEGAKYLAERFGVPQDQVMLIGHSFGSVSVLLAGRKSGARTVFALGPTEADTAFDREDFAAGQARKLAQIGLEVPLAEIEQLYAPLRAKSLLAECPPAGARRNFIWGEYEIGAATFAPYLEGFRARCGDVAEIDIVPWANHTYWAEWRSTWRYRAYALAIADEEWVDALAGAIVSKVEGAR